MKPKTIVVYGLLAVTLITWFNSSYIHLKAQLAQYLIADSWAASAAGSEIKPWPWADTWPVARIRFHGEDLYVLAGSHGSALAFGPGHVDGTALPGGDGTSVIGGHRDTHFRGLAQLEMGDIIRVQGAGRNWLVYSVDGIRIVDTREEPVMVLTDTTSRIVLVTCYPFESLLAGGPFRYVVEAGPAVGERAGG